MKRSIADDKRSEGFALSQLIGAVQCGVFTVGKFTRTPLINRVETDTLLHGKKSCCAFFFALLEV